MKENPGQVEMPGEGKKSESIFDTPKKLGEISIGMYPTTPRAYDWLSEHDINMWDYDDLRLTLIKIAEDQGRQITRREMEQLGPRLEQIMKREKDQQKMIIESGSEKKLRDRIVDIQVFHAPVYSNQNAVRIVAITEKGFRVTLRNVYGGRTYKDIAKTKQMAEEFGRTLVGKEFEFRKVSHDLAYGRGKRIRLQTMVSKTNLPELKDLDLQEWVEEHKERASTKAPR